VINRQGERGEEETGLHRVPKEGRREALVKTASRKIQASGKLLYLVHPRKKNLLQRERLGKGRV